MRRGLRALSDGVLALFLVTTALVISLELMLVHPGGGDITILRGLDMGITSIAIPGAKAPCPPGSLALVQRCTADQAQLGEGLLFFADDGTVSGGVYQGMQDGMAVLEVDSRQILADAGQIKARYAYVLPGAYHLYLRLNTPVFIAAACAFTFALFVLLRVDWRPRHKLLSPSDAEISTMFR